MAIGLFNYLIYTHSFKIKVFLFTGNGEQTELSINDLRVLANSEITAELTLVCIFESILIGNVKRKVFFIKMLFNKLKFS